MTLTSPPPARRPELVIAPPAADGACVVKDPVAGAYYQLGPREAFLLMQFDGRLSADAVLAAYAEQFDKALSLDGLEQFVSVARENGFLQAGDGVPVAAAQRPTAPPAAPPTKPRERQNVLFWRFRFFDPDRLFSAVEPWVRWAWTPAFAAAASLLALAAGMTLWADRAALIPSFADVWRWETVALVWVIAIGSIALHESAHGLTCKHYGGEVRDVGFLMMFFMPCFYCNVSDAWLFRERWKKLAVTAAGGVCDLCVWAVAVFLWRVTARDTLVNYVAFVLLTVVGARIVINLNPLMKLDGYYLLGDILDVPNLQQQGRERWKATARWLLWGAARPAGERRGAAVVFYGLLSWAFGVTMLTTMFAALAGYLGKTVGWVGAGAAAGAGLYIVSGLFRGLAGNEAWAMLQSRRGRSASWAAVAVAVPVGLVVVPYDDRATGPCQLRAAQRHELCAPVAGFLRAVRRDEGQAVAAGEVVAVLEIPNLDNRIAAKQAERREAEARVRLLEAGTRPEEMANLRERVTRAEDWRRLAEADLAKGREALAADLDRLAKQVVACRAELEFAAQADSRGRNLVGSSAESQQRREELDKRKRVSHAQLGQAEAQRVARVATGTRDAESELARRERELAEAKSALSLADAGTRPEELDAERAHRERVQEDLAYLLSLRGKLDVVCPGAGVVTTPRLAEGVGRYFREGDLIAVVEQPGVLEAEIGLSEQDVARVEPGQRVQVKVQALPFETFATTVESVAPRALPREFGDAAAKGGGPKPVADGPPSSVTVRCRLADGGAALRPGMTGHARVYTGPRSAAAVLRDRAMRYVRTEFWW